MATPKESFEHGEHNQQACDLLHTNGKFPDWTITTAFYAALHFVTSKIFPFSHPPKSSNAINFDNIEQWQKFKNYGAAKRHELLKDLVANHCHPIHERYEWLLSTSWNARYHHHQHDPLIVDKAVRHMKEIKIYCDPNAKHPTVSTKKAN
jgi:hypothetical protein